MTETDVRPSKVRSRILIGSLVALAIVLVALWPKVYRPLDPDSPRPDGALALTRLIGEYAGAVRVSNQLPSASDDVAVLLVDELSGDAVRGLLGWVADDGGVLIVPSPGSIARQGEPSDSEEDAGNKIGEVVVRDRGVCTMSALDLIDQISVYDVEPAVTTTARCFDDGDGPLVTTTRFGDGNIVEVADMLVFSNELLDQTDNAGLAVTLMVPTADASVVLLRSDVAVPSQRTEAPASGGDVELPEPPDRERVGTGGSSLADLLPPYFLWIFVQLLLAWLIFVIARALRFGKPVHEPLPVRVPGSALVEATGRLLRRTNPEVTARVLVESFREDLRVGLIQPADIDDQDLIRLAAERSGLDPDVLSVALMVPSIAGDAELVSFSAHLDTLRQEVLRDRSPTSQ